MIRKNVLAFLLTCIAGLVNAQEYNYGFEQLDSSGQLAGWNKILIQPTSLDLSGIPQPDSVVVDGAYFFPTADAHSGQRALEMRNGYDFTTGRVIPGGIDLKSTAYIYSSLQLVRIDKRPLQLGFYYKFIPAGNDTAWAVLTVYDSIINEIGTAAIAMSHPASSYTYTVKPVSYTSAASPVYMSISFATAVPGSVPAYGTRFLVDDISVPSLGVTTVAHNTLKCYPTAATGYVLADIPEALRTKEIVWQIRDIQARTVLSGRFTGSDQPAKFAVGDLPAGRYILYLHAGGQGLFTGSFSKL